MHALFARFPALKEAVPHVDLNVAETRVEQVSAGNVVLRLKRDDATSSLIGGNKVRALELLLGGASAGSTVLTVGSMGSTHALATALYARDRGLACEVITWPQEHHRISRLTAERLARTAQVTAARSPVEAYMRAAHRRGRRRMHWVPAGGSSPVGILGPVNAALELVSQLERDGAQFPDEIVLPLGSGGTAAGLIVGLSLAGNTRTVVRAVRVVPRIIGNRGHVLRLAWQTHRLICRHASGAVPPLQMRLLSVEHGAYGGAYGRELEAGRAAASALHDAGGPFLDGTYSAKAFAVARERARVLGDGAVLFWLTFDARWIER